MTGSVQIGKEMKDMKKEIKEYTDMEKSCKNCSLYQGNSCEIFHATEDVAGSGCKADEFYCSLFEEKKKTITLYRYTYEDDGEVWISNWTSKQRGLPRGCSVLKTETKEIDL